MGDRDRYQSYYDHDNRYERNAGRYENRDASQYQRGARDWEHDDYSRSQEYSRSQNFRDQDQRSYTGTPHPQERDYGQRGYASPQYPRERDFNSGYAGYDARRFPATFGSNEDRGYERGYEQPRFGGDYRPDGSAPRRDHDESWGRHLRDVGQQVVRTVKRAFRGPKGYKRSDERIREDVSDRLSQHDHLDPSEIEVTVSSSEVTLTGTVVSRNQKFLAEEIADDVSGVTEVHNQLRVRREQPATGLGETSSVLGAVPPHEARNRNARAQ